MHAYVLLTDRSRAGNGTERSKAVPWGFIGAMGPAQGGGKGRAGKMFGFGDESVA